MVRIHVVGRQGETMVAEGHVGGTLMEALRDLENGVAAVCGGNCSCGTCHVYVEPGSPVGLAAAQGDELEVLRGMGGYQPRSRLSCQVTLAADHDGLSVRLAPEE